MSGGERRAGGASPALVAGVNAVVWLTVGSNFLGYVIAVEYGPPFLVLSARLFVGGLLLLPIALVLDARRRGAGSARRWPTARQLRSSAVMAVLLSVIAQGAVVWGVQELTAGTSAILVSTTPLWVAGISLVFLRQPLARRGVLGVVLGFAGIVVLALARDGASGGIDPVAAAVTVGGAIAGAGGFVYGRHADLPDDPLLDTSLQLVMAGAMTGVLSVALGETAKFDITSVATRGWLALCYLIVFGSVIGYAALVWLARNASPAISSSNAYGGPVVALLLSAALLGESLTAAKLLSAALALTGAALMVTSTRQSGTTGSPQERRSRAT